MLVGVAVIAIAWFVTVPLRRPRAQGEEGERGERMAARLTELELRKEAKYREIRDAQLDHASGKLSDEDFEGLDAELRREAVAILAELDRAQAQARRDQT